MPVQFRRGHERDDRAGGAIPVEMLPGARGSRGE